MLSIAGRHRESHLNCHPARSENFLRNGLFADPLLVDLGEGSNFEFEPLENLKFNFTSKYVGRQYTDNSSNKDRSIDPYFINDFNVNYSFTTDLFKEVVLRLMVNNIFDVKYETNAWVYRYYYDGTPGVIDGYYPQAGINYMVGLTLKF